MQYVSWKQTLKLLKSIALGWWSFLSFFILWQFYKNGAPSITKVIAIIEQVKNILIPKMHFTATQLNTHSVRYAWLVFFKKKNFQLKEKLYIYV